MKKILTAILLSLVLIIPANAKKVCVREGAAGVAWGLVYKLIDVDCDGKWDLAKEVKLTEAGWQYTGNQWRVPEKFRTINVPEIPQLPNI